jgi:hypothetical protein
VVKTFGFDFLVFESNFRNTPVRTRVRRRFLPCCLAHYVYRQPIRYRSTSYFFELALEPPKPLEPPKRAHPSCAVHPTASLKTSDSPLLFPYFCPSHDSRLTDGRRTHRQNIHIIRWNFRRYPCRVANRYAHCLMSTLNPLTPTCRFDRLQAFRQALWDYSRLSKLSVNT